MSLPDFAFYLFSGVLVLAAFMVVATRNPVHAVMFLILCFVNATGLFVLLGAEFLAMILLVVYIGAVAVLFLFVVMMLDVDFSALKEGFLTYLPFGALIGGVVLVELIFVFSTWSVADPLKLEASAAVVNSVTNTEQIGLVLYTTFIDHFQMAGVVLLVGMIGAIVLTLRHKPGVRRQVIAEQVRRDPKKAVELVNVSSGQGLSK